MIETIAPTARHTSEEDGLKTHWLFSFSDYNDPANQQWGVLRVFNDDIVASGHGFDTHPHADMEIITLILSGRIDHRDSGGHQAVIEPGGVQRISAGRGLFHSEKNPGPHNLHLYQIWFYPREQGGEPEYALKDFTPSDLRDNLCPLVSGVKREGALSMRADATLYRSILSMGRRIEYAMDPGRRAFVYVHKGFLEVNGKRLPPGGQARISDEVHLKFRALMEVDFIFIDAADRIRD